MKTVKEIKDFKDRYRHMAINPQNTQDLNQFVFDALIGITEHLEAAPTGGVDKHGIRWTCKFVDPNCGPSDADIEARIVRAEERQKKIEKWTEKFQKPTCVKMPLDDAIDLPLYTEQVRREGMIAALRWVCDDCKGDKSMCGGETQARCHVLAAIARLEDGGDL